ncbi:putative sec1-like protein [Helianthus anomalus]
MTIKVKPQGPRFKKFEIWTKMSKVPKPQGPKWQFTLYNKFIAAKIHSIRRKTGLNNVGKLEQDLVFGDAGTKDVINFLKEQMDIPQEYKVRLLMIYAATRPEKFESDKLTKLMELANLSRDDMNAVYNMRFLEAAPETKTTGALSVKLHLKKKHGLRKDRPGEESALQLSRFHPMIEELIEKLSKNELPMNEYPCMNDPSPPSHGASHSGSARVHDNTPGRSMRSRPSTWARPRSSDDRYPYILVSEPSLKTFKNLWACAKIQYGPLKYKLLENT